MIMHCFMAIKTPRIPLLLLGLMLLQSFSVIAQQADTSALVRVGFFHKVGDSLKAYIKEPLAPKPLQWKAVVIPTALITYGTLAVTTSWFDDVNLLGRRWASGTEDPNQRTSIDDYTEYAGAAAVLGLNIAGVRGKHNIVDAGILYTSSIAIAHVFTIPTKRITREARPDSSDLLSFPSGHTSTAFVGAEFLRQEYKGVSPWIGAGGYAVAVLTGALRMYNNKHWFSDVVAGAGVGILSTRLSYFLYPKLKNAILGKSAPLTTMLVPSYQGGIVGVYLVHQFQ
jgi:membrane-associated phospholipid phosphatase